MSPAVVVTKKPVARKPRASGAKVKKETASEPDVPASEQDVPVLEPERVPEPDTTSENTDEAQKLSRKQRQVNQLVESSETLTSLLSRYIAEQKEMRNTDFVKVLKTLEKEVKRLSTAVSKISKTRTETRSSDANSGFRKPVQISEDIARFTGFNHEELHSRVDVTNYICKYIKDNNLQTKNDGRVIRPDAKLSKLLNYDKTKDGKLTYARIQSLLKTHYTKA
jgi:chromatin remodeling complex protein RSC6